MGTLLLRERGGKRRGRKGMEERGERGDKRVCP